jgi:hypothetical protein
MGARVLVHPQVRPRRRFGRAASVSGLSFIALDVRNDRHGEYFDIGMDPASGAELCVLDVQPKDRHLLLLARRASAQSVDKHKFLCGHDERHWFVAAVPEKAGASTVRQAKLALKPEEVVRAEVRKGLREKVRFRRRNPAAVRQGEWFFVPAPALVVNPKLVLRHEPLVRTGKAHWAEECFRTGGETVYVCRQYPNGVTEREYRRLRDSMPDARVWRWQVLRRNAEVYVRGRIRHSDHKTIHLDGWHRVFMNTENQSVAMQHVVFLD